MTLPQPKAVLQFAGMMILVKIVSTIIKPYAPVSIQPYLP